MSKYDELSQEDVERSLQLLTQIEQTLHREREANWINGVKVLIADLKYIAADLVSRQEMLVEVRSTFRTMMCAKDGFGDIIIWRDDLHDRVRANKEFDALRSELWKLLEE
jgi:hypothetical protein